MDNNLKTIINTLFYDSKGQILVSSIFGLSIALLFNRVCKDNCTVYYAPFIEDIKGKVFKLEDTCYMYEPYIIKCNENNKNYKYYDINNPPDNIL